LPKPLHFDDHGPGREAQSVTAHRLIIRDEVKVIPDLIDAFHPGGTAKGNYRSFNVLKGKLDLLRDSLGEWGIRRKQFGDSPRGELRKTAMDADGVKQIGGG
jgi:hypothetical protein